MKVGYIRTSPVNTEINSDYVDMVILNQYLVIPSVIAH